MSEFFVPADQIGLLGLRRWTPATGEVRASDPCAAALLIGLGVPEAARDRIVRHLVSATPRKGLVDGMVTYVWNGPGFEIELLVNWDESSQGRWSVEIEPPETIEGEVVKAEKP